MLPSVRHRHAVLLSDPREKNKRKTRKKNNKKRVRYVGAEGNGNGYVEQKKYYYIQDGGVA